MTRPTLVRKTIILALLAIILFEIPFGIPSRSQQNVADFSTSSDSINSAFFSVYGAEQNGGDVSRLVEKLNVAIVLFQKAQAENATDPAGALTDSENATSIAQVVRQGAETISNSSQTGQLRWYESIGTILTALIVSALLYLNGDRIYRRLWLFIYRKHLVKKSDE
jgi:predicted PurR-regulated permease PerM